MSTATLTRPETTLAPTAPQHEVVPPRLVDYVKAPIDTARIVLTSYRSFAAWRDLALMSVLLVYGGGAFFFWLHGVAIGEQGPAISHWQHWLLDSTIGFVSLTPVLFVLIPLAKHFASARALGRPVRPAVLAGLIGGTFALVTAPGPFVHGLIAGEGKFVATWAEGLFGIDPAIAAVNAAGDAGLPLAVETIMQVGFGFPVYILLALVAVGLGKAVSKR